MSVDQRFKYILKHLDINATSISKELNVSKTALSRIASGDTMPSSKILIPLGEKFGINLNWFLLGTGDMFTDKQGASNGTKKNSGVDVKTLQKENKQLKDQNEQLKAHLKDKEEIISLLKERKV
jgi:transcriptional regulator with XRE-family HTH domain